MAKIDSNTICCPNCQGSLAPRIMSCETCNLKIEADFQPGPMSMLSAEHLQFIQLFIHCEGSIREMEKAMGVSYPTVKAKLADVRAALALPANSATTSKDTSKETANETPKPAKKDLAEVLNDLQAGNIPFDEALKLIRKLK